MVLMTGFGYDPGHSIVKARREGLLNVLYKPFRLDQLVSGVEEIVSAGEISNGNTSTGNTSIGQISTDNENN